AAGISRGDILAIATTSTYSGHLAIVTAPAKEIPTQLQPIYSGTKQWAVSIADSTQTAHGCNPSYPDSRWVGDCTTGHMKPGAGKATIRLYTDSLTGILLGFTW